MTEGRLLFSVILPVRNGEASLLERALKSVATQTYPHYEILLIDDGSDAEHAKMLDTLAEEDKHIRLFHIDHSGVSAARNFAAKRALGDILTYLDADDALSPVCFEEAADLFRNSDIDALWGGTLYVSDGQMRDLLCSASSMKARSSIELQNLTVKLTPERIHQTRAECIGEPYRFENGGYINRGIAARMLRKRVFSEEGCLFPEGIRMYEDAIWNLTMLKSLNVCYVRSVWYYYYENDASASNKYNPDILEVMEVPVMQIRSIMDLNDPLEYTAYTRLVMDSLRYVYKCLYGNPLWDGGYDEHVSLKQHIYSQMPWKEIGTYRFITSASGKDWKKAVLFKMHLLFLYWKIVWKNM